MRWERIRRPWWLAAAIIVLLGLVVGALALFRPGSPAPSVSPTARRGWIFHEVDRITVVRHAGAGRYSKLTEERWTLNAPPYRTRRLTFPSFASPRIEVGGSEDDALVYDPKTDTIYEGGSGLTNEAFEDPASYYRKSVANGAWKIKGKTELDGRTVFRLEPATSSGTIAFVDARTYRPVEIRSPGLPLVQPSTRERNECGFVESEAMPRSTTVVRTVTYEYLPPTRKNLMLLDVQAQHRNARVVPADKMPAAFRKNLAGPCGGTIRPSAR